VIPSSFSFAWEELEFEIQEGTAWDWRRVIDTSRPSPQDLVEEGPAQPLQDLRYRLSPRSVAVFVRP